MLFWKRIVVGDNERVLLFRNKRFVNILGPGEYRVWTGLRGAAEERFTVMDPVFTSEWKDFLVKECPSVVEANFIKIETGDAEVALVYLDGKFNRVIPPGNRVLLWKGWRAVTAEVINVNEKPEIDKDRILALAKLGRESLALFTAVEDNKAGILYLDNQFARVLGPGTYGFWAVRAPRVEMVDLRRQILEVPGQEILTKDKVSIRVNIAAEFTVTDPVKAVVAVKNFSDYLYRRLQLAVRVTLGKRTLDEVLAEKVDVDPEAAAGLRTEFAALGVEVGVIALKDIILPGEIREILNHVVTAEKQAQANLIRRREETAATRSLLNTAKLMEDNPTLIRLKELETLEKLTEKVGNLTVLGGFENLMERLFARGPK